MADEFTLAPPQAQSNGTGVTYESVQNGFNYLTKSFLVFVNTLSAQPPSGAAGGDLSGAYPNPTVARVNGVAAGTMANQNANAVAITGGAISGTSVAATTLSAATPLPVSSGGTGKSAAGAATANAIGALAIASNLSDLNSTPTARTNLGLGTISTQNANNVAVTGGTVDNTPIGQTTRAAGAFTNLAVTSALTVANGGTGAATLTAHGVLIGGGTGAIVATATGTSGQPLLSGGAAADPAYGNLAVSAGGTGATTLTAHGVLVGEGTSAVAVVGPSATAGQALISKGAAADPAFGNPTGALINVQVFTSSGTYTPTSGTSSVIVEVIGGGGGGGGTAATAAAQSAAAGGGGGGSFARALVTSAFSGVTVTVGAAGSAGAAGANAGGSGGTTSFGSIVSCPGGSGGAAGNASSGAGIGGESSGGAAPTISGAITILSSAGRASSFPAMILTAGTLQSSGAGANAPFGSGGAQMVGSGAGASASGNGSGGGGAAAAASQSAFAGAAGAAGKVIVYEYA